MTETKNRSDGKEEPSVKLDTRFVVQRKQNVLLAAASRSYAIIMVLLHAPIQLVTDRSCSHTPPQQGQRTIIILPRFRVELSSLEDGYV